jgi:hypothetical protein
MQFPSTVSPQHAALRVFRPPHETVTYLALHPASVAEHLPCSGAHQSPTLQGIPGFFGFVCCTHAGTGLLGTSGLSPSSFSLSHEHEDSAPTKPIIKKYFIIFSVWVFSFPGGTNPHLTKVFLITRGNKRQWSYHTPLPFHGVKNFHSIGPMILKLSDPLSTGKRNHAKTFAFPRTLEYQFA